MSGHALVNMPMSVLGSADMGQLDLLDSRTSKNQRAVLARLQQGPASNVELNEICFRYGARIHELQKFHGYKISKKHSHDGVWVYTLEE